MSALYAALTALVAEHRMNAVVDPRPEEPAFTRVKCDGETCDFYAEGPRYWDVVREHDAHFVAILAAHAPAPDDQGAPAAGARQYTHVRCWRPEEHPGHTHINEGPHGGCGLPEWCDGKPVAPAAGVDQGARLSEEEREALTFALCAPDPDRAPVTEIQALYVVAAVERILAARLASAVTGDEPEVWHDADITLPEPEDVERLTLASPATLARVRAEAIRDAADALYLSRPGQPNAPAREWLHRRANLIDPDIRESVCQHGNPKSGHCGWCTIDARARVLRDGGGE